MKKTNLIALIPLCLFLLLCIACIQQNDQVPNLDTLEEQNAENNSATDETLELAQADSPEYASAFVCAMHCKGSGSEQAGKCPSCGADYKKNENYIGDIDVEENLEETETEELRDGQLEKRDQG